jgi:hypothetical protein
MEMTSHAHGQRHRVPPRGPGGPVHRGRPARAEPRGVGQAAAVGRGGEEAPGETRGRGLVLVPLRKRKSYRVGPKVSWWPKILTVNPY